VKVEETETETRFSADVKTLFKIITKIQGAGVGDQPPVFGSIQKYVLTKKRAKLKITAKPNEKTIKDGEPPEASVEIRTGPTEHVFLSASLPVTKIKDLKFDDDGKTIQPADTPSEFLIGVDFMVGDLLAEKRQFFDGFTLKTFVTPSKRPLENVGIGVGYRLPRVDILGFSLDNVTPFGAAIRVSRTDATTGEENVEMKFVGGLSFNLDKALDWLGDDEE
jgi:hypothetical protein